MLKKSALLLLGSCLSFASFAGSMGVPPPMPMIEVHPWSVTASFGYTSFEYGTDGTGQTPLGRFAIGRSLYDLGYSSFGAEMGVQNGTSMRLFVPQAVLDYTGGLPVGVEVKPMLDLLGTLRISLTPTNAVFSDVKVGLAYRRMDVNRNTGSNKGQFAGELQLGVGMAIAESATLSVLYQGVYGSALDYTVNVDGLTDTEIVLGAFDRTAHIGNIPIQNGLLVSLNVSL